MTFLGDAETGLAEAKRRNRCIRMMVLAFVAAFLAVFEGTMAFGLNQRPEYRSTAVMQMLTRADLAGPWARQETESRARSDFNDRVKAMESAGVVQAVADRLKPEELRRFMAPFAGGNHFGHAPTVEELLDRGREVNYDRESLIIRVIYEHPDPQVAAQIANYFAEEIIANDSRADADRSMRLVEDLQLSADQEKKKAEEIQQTMNDLIAEYGGNIVDPGAHSQSEPAKGQDKMNPEALAKIQAEYQSLNDELKDAQAEFKNYVASAQSVETQF